MQVPNTGDPNSTNAIVEKVRSEARSIINDISTLYDNILEAFKIPNVNTVDLTTEFNNIAFISERKMALLAKEEDKIDEQKKNQNKNPAEGGRKPKSKKAPKKRV